jgi:hypothetical protein
VKYKGFNPSLARTVRISGLKRSFMIRFMFSAMMVCYSGMFLSKAQTILNSAEVEKISYRLFNEAKWDSLILISNNALHDGIDYFYLRVRLGIACYSKAEYRKAATELEYARSFNPDDVYTNQSLYLAYVYSGRMDDARQLAGDFTETDKQKLKVPETRLIESLYLEGGPSMNDEPSQYQNINLAGRDNVYGDKDVYGTSNYYHAGLMHTPLPFLRLYQGYGHIDIPVERTVVTREPGSTAPVKTRDTTGTYTYRQNDYYLSASFNLGWGWTISPAFHFIQTNAESFSLYWDLARNVYVRQTYSGNYDDHVYALSISKNYYLFNCRLFASYSDLLGSDQQIVGTSVTVYPRENLNLYATSSLSYFFETHPSNKRFIFDQSLGFHLSGKTWFEANLSLGELTHYIDKNGYLAYNTPDKILFRGGASLIIPVNEHFKFSFKYIYYKKGSLSEYVEGSRYKTRTVDYNNHSIIGGLQWNF